MKNQKIKMLCAVISFFVILLSPAYAKEKITVFAAASLTNALQEISTQYEKDNDIQVELSFASSSALARQIVYGAAADLFISADLQWMNYLKEKQLIDINHETILLGNALVLIAPVNSLLTEQSIVFQKDQPIDWKGLLKGSKLAVGDPDHVPAGIYTKQALTYLGDFDTVSPMMARANNVRNALLFVARGEAVLGVVYYSDSVVSDQVKVIAAFPEQSHEPIEYPMAIVKDHSKATVNQFYDYLKSDKVVPIFEKYGFTVKK